MNTSPVQVAPSRSSLWPWVLLALTVSLLAMTSQSLWIDEAYIATKAAQPTLAGWWRLMQHSGGDLQMPFYTFYVWAFAKIFGFSEWALRAANIPIFVIGFTAFVTAFPKPQRFFAAAVASLCPFAWYYLDEARPYAMQLGSSLLIFGAIYRLCGDTPLEPARARNWLTAFWLGIIVLCGSHLLGVIWAGAALFALLLLLSPKPLFQLFRNHWQICVSALILLAALACYYVWTIKFGTRSLDAGDKSGGAALTAVKSAAHFRQGFGGGTGLTSTAYLIFDLLGFSGLGPGKLEIRAGRLSAFRHFAAPLALFALTLFSLLALWLPRMIRRPGLPKRLALAFVVVLPLLLLTLAGHFVGFLVLSRHCTPLMPAILFVFSLALCSACSSGRASLKILSVAFLVLSLLSCLSIRFAARHQKDDYRDAARTALAALDQGKKVWWSADDYGAAYYHLLVAAAPGETGHALLLLNPAPQTLATLPAPDVVVLSKPDLYDNQQALQNYVSNNPYSQIATLPAFAVWQRKTLPDNR